MRIHRPERHRECLVEAVAKPGEQSWLGLLLLNRHRHHSPLGLTVTCVGDDFAIANFYDALRPRCNLPVMRDDDDGASFAVQFLKDTKDFLATMAVERTRGLVRQNNISIVDKGASDGNALLLAPESWLGR